MSLHEFCVYFPVALGLWALFYLAIFYIIRNDGENRRPKRDDD